MKLNTATFFEAAGGKMDGDEVNWKYIDSCLVTDDAQVAELTRIAYAYPISEYSVCLYVDGVRVHTHTL